MKDDLCKLCNGTCAFNTTAEPYSDYMGAFRCMAEGNNDRVAFVKQTTFADTNNKYGVESDFKLLCPDGTKKGLSYIRVKQNRNFKIHLEIKKVDEIYR